MNDLLTVLWVGNLNEAQLGYLVFALLSVLFGSTMRLAVTGKLAREQLVLSGLKVQMLTGAVCLGPSGAGSR